MIYNLLSYYAFGHWVVCMGGFAFFSQSGEDIYSYALCVGWAFHWQSCGGLLVGFLGFVIDVLLAGSVIF